MNRWVLQSGVVYRVRPRGRGGQGCHNCVKIVNIPSFLASTDILLTCSLSLYVLSGGVPNGTVEDGGGGGVV